MAYKSESAVLKWAIYFVLFQIDYRWRRGFKIKVLDSVFLNRKWNSRGEVEFFFRSWARNFIDEKIHLTLHCKRLGIDGWKFSSWSKYNCVSFGLVPFDPGFPIPSVEKTKIPALVNRDRSFFPLGDMLKKWRERDLHWFGGGNFSSSDSWPPWFKTSDPRFFVGFTAVWCFYGWNGFQKKYGLVNRDFCFTYLPILRCRRVYLNRRILAHSIIKNEITRAFRISNSVVNNINAVVPMRSAFHHRLYWLFAVVFGNWYYFCRLWLLMRALVCYCGWYFSISYFSHKSKLTLRVGLNSNE